MPKSLKRNQKREFCGCIGILRGRNSTSCLNDLQKRVFRYGTDTQTKKMDIAPSRLNRPRGGFSENQFKLAFDLDFYFEDIFRFGNISVLVTFQFW